MYDSQTEGQSPVMAVLVSRSAICNLQKQIVSPRIQLLVKANREIKNILYYFSLREVMLKERRIQGFYWDARYDIWLNKEFPLPDILYIRGGVSKKYAQIFNSLFALVSRSGKVINYPRLNKWQLYQIMAKDPLIKSCLPSAREVNNPGDIKMMLRSNNAVYLKSQLGRKGQNVMRIETLAGDLYRYCYFRHGQLIVRQTFSIKKLLAAVNTFFHGKSILIQKAIQLMEFENKLLDMRAEMQRNGRGELEIVGIAARMGKPGSPITTHGEAYPFEHFFLDKMGYTKEKLGNIITVIHKFLFKVYKLIEDNYGEYVEIGIDFAIDVNERIWLIEANSQSTKVSLEKAFNEEVLSRAYKNILQYARFLHQKDRRTC